ncbi:hypothetical protein TJA_20360 [Thermus sp. LT1-2-5]
MKALDALSELVYAEEKVLTNLVGRVAQGLGPAQPLREGPGLILIPFEDGREGGAFYLGEALVYEAWIRFPMAGVEGYGAALGFEAKRARALAYLDAALQAGLEVEAIMALAEMARSERERREEEFWRKVERTRLEVETL